MAKNEMKNIKKNIEVKKKKKTWVGIIAPKIFNNMEVGDSYCSGPESLVGKVVKVNMMALTQDPRKQSMTASLKITEIKGDKVLSEFDALTMGSSHLKRVVRRETSKIEDAFEVEGKDKTKYVIKPLAVARTHIHHSLQTDIRNRWREIIREEFLKSELEDVIGMIIGGRFQKELKDMLRKITPLSILEIKAVKRI